MRSRRALLCVTGALGLLLLVAGGAWACTTAATIGLGASGGPPGTAVEVVGQEFPTTGTTEVYWEPTDGEPQFLFEAEGNSWTENTVIPEDASSGTHYIKAYGYYSDGEVRGTATAAFTVPHGSVEGQVTNDGASTPVHAAEVTVSQDGQVVGSDRTDSQGSFRVADLDQGEHEVVVDRDGYQSSSTLTQVSAGEASQVNVAVARESDAGPQPQGSAGSDGSESQPDGPQGSQGAEAGDESSPEGSPIPQDPEAPDDSGESPDATADSPESESDSEADETDEPGNNVEAGLEQAAPSADAPSSNGGASEATSGGASAGAGEGDEPASADTAADDEGDVVPSNESNGDGESGGGQANPDEVRARVDNTGVTRAATPSADSSTSDLWSGLEASEHQVAMTEAQSGDDRVGVGQQLAVAIGVLGTGMVLLAGGGLAAVRRQRVPALANRRR